MPNPELIERIDGLGSTGFSGHGYRHLGPGFEPLSAEGARILGGRWNPPRSFPVLYVALDVHTTVAEFYRAAERQGRRPEDLLPRKLVRYEIELTAVLDLSDPAARTSLSLTGDRLVSNDVGHCRAIGEAAHYLGLEAILVPSAVSSGRVLPIFYAKLRAGSSVHDVETDTWTSLPPRAQA